MGTHIRARDDSGKGFDQEDGKKELKCEEKIKLYSILPMMHLLLLPREDIISMSISPVRFKYSKENQKIFLNIFF